MTKNSRQTARTSLVALAAGLVLCGAGIGCVRRTLTINSDPQGALVYLNDAEVGRTPVSVDFLWYGDYDVILRKEGYATLQTNERVNEPWYQVPPIDFREELLQRAEALRERALYEAD